MRHLTPPTLVLLGLVLLLAHAARAATHTVAPGGSIQAAHDAAAPGDTIVLTPGQYYERVTVTTPVTLQGEPGAILDGSDALSGWVSQGSGYWRAPTPGYSPQALTVTSHKLTVLRLLDDAMDGTVCYQCSGNGKTILARSASDNYWDGIEGLFGVTGGHVYLRLRRGEDPGTMAVRVAPSATITIDGADRTLIRGLEIGGGQYAIHIKAANRVVVEDCTLRNGRGRVRIDSGIGTIVRHNTLDARLIGSTPGYAQTPYQAGAWSGPASTARSARENLYRVDKFEVGASREQNAGIVVDNGTAGLPGAVLTQIVGNTIQGGTLGVELQDGAGTRIVGNTLRYHSAESIWPNETAGDLPNIIAGNVFGDAHHSIRIQSMEDPHPPLYIYGNWFNQTEPGAKHVHFSFGTPDATAPGQVTVYHNSFTGKGWAMDLGGVYEGMKQLPQVQILNNLVSVQGYSATASSTGGISSGGLTATSGQTGYVGLYSYNWCTDSCSGQPGSSPQHTANLGEHGGVLVWPTPGATPLAPPAGHPTLNSGLRLDTAWTVGTVTRQALPGMTAAYYGDGQPDRGSVQAGGGGTPEPPEPPPSDSTAPQVSIISPAPGAVVSGVVMVQAQASDNVGVVGVQLFVDAVPLGTEACCSSVERAWDTGAATVARHLLSARARDAAGNEAVAQRLVRVEPPPIPPDPPTPGVGALTCTGTLAQVPGPIALQCIPETTARRR